MQTHVKKLRKLVTNICALFSIYLFPNNIFHPNQHGFRRDHGFKKLLIELVCNMATKLDQGEEVEAFLLDFSKASI